MRMRYRNLGSSGARVSEICLGTMTFGEADANSMMHGASASEEASHAMMTRAFDAGINFWDTADVYGQDGLSERVIGRWLANNGHRDDLVLATKCRFGMGPGPNDRGASRFHVKRALEASLRRLGTDRVDLYQIHMQDARTPEEEVVRALDELVREGKVMYFGASNYAAYRLVESLWAADRIGANRFVTLQAQYSLVERSLDVEHLPALRRFGLGLLAYSPLGGGFLSGKYRAGEAAPAGSRFAQQRHKDRLVRHGSERNWAVLGAVTEIAGALGATPAQVALGWVLRQPAVSAAILGVRDLAQLETGLGAAALVLPDDAIKRLDELSAPRLGPPYDFLKSVDGTW
jgi:aryl-alcohol dehydrogenase-like predicted oxidoreductase